MAVRDLNTPDPLSRVASASFLAAQSPHADAVEVPPAALKAAQEISESSRRRLNIPVRKSFVRAAEGDLPPMTAVYRGGRSGVVALKLYLGVIWRCAQPPYETDKPTRAWATLLGLPDPSTKGARRIAAAAKTLADRDLLTIVGQAGHPNILSLLQEDRSGDPYEPPGDAYFRADRFKQFEERDRHVYFLINTRLWTEGHIQSMSGAALVMLLILLAERGGDRHEVWFSTKAFPERYQISENTRAAGTRELIDRNLLWIERRPLPINGSNSVFEPNRYRNVYHLKNAALAARDSEAESSPKVGSKTLAAPGRNA